MQKKSSENKGLLVSFEGIEGVGKTTQTELLLETLRKHQIPCVLTREPGGTDLGDSLRQCLLRDYEKPLDAVTELCVLIASRRHHIQHVVEPNLKAGKVVIVDRFIDATLAYQGSGRGLDPQFIIKLHQALAIYREPDLTFLLDLPVESSRARLQERSFSDRIEREHNDFFNKVRYGYLNLAAQHPDRIQVLKANAPREDLAMFISQEVLGALNEN